MVQFFKLGKQVSMKVFVYCVGGVTVSLRTIPVQIAASVTDSISCLWWPHHWNVQDSQGFKKMYLSVMIARERASRPITAAQPWSCLPCPVTAQWQELVSPALQDWTHRRSGFTCLFVPEHGRNGPVAAAWGAGCLSEGPQNNGMTGKKKASTPGAFQLHFHPVLKRTFFPCPHC